MLAVQQTSTTKKVLEPKDMTSYLELIFGENKRMDDIISYSKDGVYNADVRNNDMIYVEEYKTYFIYLDYVPYEEIKIYFDEEYALRSYKGSGSWVNIKLVYNIESNIGFYKTLLGTENTEEGRIDIVETKPYEYYEVTNILIKNNEDSPVNVDLILEYNNMEIILASVELVSNDTFYIDEKLIIPPNAKVYVAGTNDITALFSVKLKYDFSEKKVFSEILNIEQKETDYVVSFEDVNIMSKVIYFSNASNNNVDIHVYVRNKETQEEKEIMAFYINPKDVMILDSTLIIEDEYELVFRNLDNDTITNFNVLVAGFILTLID